MSDKPFPPSYFFDKLGIEITTETNLVRMAFLQQQKHAASARDLFDLRIAYQEALIYIEELSRQDNLLEFLQDELLSNEIDPKISQTDLSDVEFSDN